MTDHLVRVPSMEVFHGRLDPIVQASRGRTVLHLGCVDEGLTAERLTQGMLMHERLAGVATELWGIDIDRAGLDILREQGFQNLVAADLEDPSWTKEVEGIDFDVIAAPELLEHLNNPGLVLDNIRPLFGNGTVLVASVPNGLRLLGRAHLWRGYEHVNPDHNFWFSYATLMALLRKNRYQVLDLAAYSYTDHRRSLASGLRGLGRFLLGRQPRPGIRMQATSLVRRLLYSRNAAFADGFVVTARPMEPR